ncbi:MAG: hypothetical protein HoeaKO_31170 [Hoeflea alexandrii]
MRQASIWTTSMAPPVINLLEEDAVLAHLAGGDLHRGNGFADGLAVAFDIVGAGRLLDEEGVASA